MGKEFVCRGSKFSPFTLFVLNKLDATPTSDFQPIRLLDPSCSYKFKYLMTNSADPDKKPTYLDLPCLQKQANPGLAGLGLRVYSNKLVGKSFYVRVISLEGVSHNFLKNDWIL